MEVGFKSRHPGSKSVFISILHYFWAKLLEIVVYTGCLQCLFLSSLKPLQSSFVPITPLKLFLPPMMYMLKNPVVNSQCSSSVVSRHDSTHLVPPSSGDSCPRGFQAPSFLALAALPLSLWGEPHPPDLWRLVEWPRALSLSLFSILVPPQRPHSVSWLWLLPIYKLMYIHLYL